MATAGLGARPPTAGATARLGVPPRPPVAAMAVREWEEGRARSQAAIEYARYFSKSSPPNPGFIFFAVALLHALLLFGLHALAR